MINLGHINLRPYKMPDLRVKVRGTIRPTKASNVTTNREHNRENSNAGYNRKGRTKLIQNEESGKDIDVMV